MRERPILFKGPMVRAILDGTKTQTRRVVKFSSWPEDPGKRCPYGDVGDRLWVRETFRPETDGETAYRADFQGWEADGTDWKPSIFMPRGSSRIELEVTEIRALRLQDISEEDAAAEGAMTWWNGLSQEEQFGMYDGGRGPIAAFRMLWDSINAKRGVGWDTNPWVWAVSFRRVKP